MNAKVHVSNLSEATTENDLRTLFSTYGNVAEVSVPRERPSGRSRGFAFVTMATPEAARAAIQALNGKAIGTNTIAVSEARPR
jgi:RNA recognition motif-containing protein